MKRLFGLAIAFIAGASLAFVPPCPECNGHEVSGPTEQQQQGGPAVTSKAAFLMEANSGRVIMEHAADNKLPIASMVKITTLAVIYDALANGEIAIDQMVPVSETAHGMGGSQAFLDAGSEYPVDELIKSIIVASANDSCVAMAELIAGSETEFVNRMNALATKLGMTNTNYVNATGLPAVGAHSTARDVATIYTYMMQSEFYGRHEKTWMYDLTHPGGRVTGLTNTNRHVRFFDGITGGKTGFTAEAGHCLAVSATRGMVRPVAVVIGSPDSKTRFDETGALMNHVFGAYTNELVVSRETVLATARVRGAYNDTVDLFAERDFYDLVRRGERVKPTTVVEVNENIRAPFGATDSLGTVSVTRDGRAVAELDLVARIDVEKMNMWDSVRKVVSKYKIAA
ncbi:MAG: D-alanyl-D-alanine carboxypeptidase [Firmicutes bacterium]|nr:D-alanyl-D-alanine carboxypeptidase [Bacillota bacterium]